MKVQTFIARKEEARIELTFDANLRLLEIDTPSLSRFGVSNTEQIIDKVEQILKAHKSLTLVFRTTTNGTQTMKFMLNVIKMIERYEWLEGNKVRIHWRHSKVTSTRKTIQERLTSYMDMVMQNSNYGEIAMA